MTEKTGTRKYEDLAHQIVESSKAEEPYDMYDALVQDIAAALRKVEDEMRRHCHCHLCAAELGEEVTP
jgi:hypothetical protein